MWFNNHVNRNVVIEPHPMINLTYFKSPLFQLTS